MTRRFWAWAGIAGVTVLTVLLGAMLATPTAARAGTITNAPPAPAISVQTTADHASVMAGDSIGFQVQVANAAHAATATNVVLTDGGFWNIDSESVAHACAVLISDPVPGSNQPAVDSVECRVGDLAAGATFTVHLTDTAPASCAAPMVTNLPSVTAANESGGPFTASATVTVAPQPCPALSMTLTADAERVTAGGAVGFTIHASNTGTGPATEASVCAALPSVSGLAWKVDPPYSGPGTCAIGTDQIGPFLECGIGDLVSGASLQVHVTSPTTTSTCGTLTSNASIGASNATADRTTASVAMICTGVSGAHITVPDTGSTGGASLQPVALLAGGVLLVGAACARWRRRR